MHHQMIVVIISYTLTETFPFYIKQENIECIWKLNCEKYFRKCSASNRILAAKDHASIQINIAEVDESTGRMTMGYKTYAICGAIRRMGESDDCINRLAKKDGIIDKKF